MVCSIAIKINKVWCINMDHFLKVVWTVERDRDGNGNRNGDDGDGEIQVYKL